jgi:ring-1,2-phenylacetyl-CoA epoxidase subunit PaaD
MVTDMHMSLPSLQEIWAWLDSVNDPEIPILSVVDLGIVRDVRWTDGSPDFTSETQSAPRSESTLVVTVTPTYSGCPATLVIKNDIRQALKERGINKVVLETQLSPAWTTDSMTERGRERLREYGIAPPEPQAANPSTLIMCPRCGSSDTRVVSRFGSTPCKAFYICNSCLEPFDYFKCH